MNNDRVQVKAFKIAPDIDWMPSVFGGEESAAKTLVCECGHTLAVNDAWVRVYEPEPGGWLVVNQQGRAAYRSPQTFDATAVHIKDNYYWLPLTGDLR